MEHLVSFFMLPKQTLTPLLDHRHSGAALRGLLPLPLPARADLHAARRLLARREAHRGDGDHPPHRLRHRREHRDQIQ